MTRADTVTLTCPICGQGNRLPAARLGEGPKCGICGTALVDGKVAELDPTTHDKVTGSDGLPVLIDYWAPWCGPCRQMAPEFAKAAKALAPGVRLMKLNTENHPAITQRAAVVSIPALILYRNGREVARLIGMRRAADIIAFVRQNVAA